MINSIILEILLRKIETKEINPQTNKQFEISDIKIEEYKIKINELLDEQNRI